MKQRLQTQRHLVVGANAARAASNVRAKQANSQVAALQQGFASKSALHSKEVSCMSAKHKQWQRKAGNELAQAQHLAAASLEDAGLQDPRLAKAKSKCLRAELEFSKQQAHELSERVQRTTATGRQVRKLQRSLGLQEQATQKHAEQAERFKAAAAEAQQAIAHTTARAASTDRADRLLARDPREEGSKGKQLEDAQEATLQAQTGCRRRHSLHRSSPSKWRG